MATPAGGGGEITPSWSVMPDVGRNPAVRDSFLGALVVQRRALSPRRGYGFPAFRSLFLAVRSVVTIDPIKAIPPIAAAAKSTMASAG
jgi:hypothetical protein